MRVAVWLLSAAILTQAAWCADDPDTRDLKEIALGRQLAAEVERQAKLLDDAIVAEYLNRLGQNLVRHSGSTLPFTFKVLDSTEVNAFALPGGFVYVNKGMIQVCETEAELGGALSHEIAHVTARHMTRQAKREELVRLLSGPPSLLGGWIGYAGRQAARVGIPLTFLAFSREFESEADALGVRYAAAAGYDPTATVDLFERLLTMERKHPGTIAKVFSSHPAYGERMRNAQEEIGKMPSGNSMYLVNSSEYMEMRARIPFGQKPGPKPGEDPTPTLKRDGRVE